VLPRREALTVRGSDTPDLLLRHLEMGGIDGIELIRRSPFHRLVTRHDIR
jgi:hypothetical protein